MEIEVQEGPARRYQSAVWTGIVLILITGLVHIVDAPGSFQDATYKGLLFAANGIGSLIAAYGISRDDRQWGWGLGLLVAGGALAGYVLSRTVGLPGGLTDDIGNWFEPLGVVSMAAEALFVVLAARVLGTQKTADRGAIPASRSFR